MKLVSMKDCQYIANQKDLRPNYIDVFSWHFHGLYIHLEIMDDHEERNILIWNPK